MQKKKIFPKIILCILVLFLFGCQPKWKIQLANSDSVIGVIAQNDVSFYIDKSFDPIDEILLGQLLFAKGFTLIDKISLSDRSGEKITFSWNEISMDAKVSQRGDVIIGDEIFQPTNINISPAQLSKDIHYSIMDIAPTIAYAIDLPELPNAKGKVWLSDTGEFDHAVMIMLDGLQYQKLVSLINADALPFLETLDTLQPGLTVYPPITTTSSAALLTSNPPEINGVFGYGYRTTEIKTLFDLAVENNKTVVAVEGYAIAFNLRNAEVILSGDKNGDGFTDDNVYANSLEIIRSGMPDLLYIHFHDIDDMGHKYGPDSSEYESAIIRVDQYLSEIYKALPQNSFIAIFADHGMHETESGGNHGALISSDLIIPIIFMEK